MAELAGRVGGLTGAQLVILRRRLEEERDRLQSKIELTASAENATGSRDPMAADVEDFGEMAQDIMLEDTDRALGANERRLLLQVEHALVLMDSGSYGRSEVTGEAIPFDRLDALPWATTNVDDAETPK